MANVRALAKYLVDAYEKYTGSSFTDSELKLHKLMYFAQRESLALTGEPLFDENFEGWKHGPVLPSLRYFFDYNSNLTDDELRSIPEEAKYVIGNVLDQYAQYAAWSLRNMSHEEYSWKKSREGLDSDESGNCAMELEDIKKDAEKVRLYDHVWGMYFDEFEDDVTAGEGYVQ